MIEKYNGRKTTVKLSKSEILEIMGGKTIEEYRVIVGMDLEK